MIYVKNLFLCYAFLGGIAVQCMDTNHPKISPQVPAQKKPPTAKALQARAAYKQTRNNEECFSLTATRSRTIPGEREAMIKPIKKKKDKK